MDTLLLVNSVYIIIMFYISFAFYNMTKTMNEKLDTFTQYTQATLGNILATTEPDNDRCLQSSSVNLFSYPTATQILHNHSQASADSLSFEVF